MSPERWHELKDLFFEVLELPPEDRRGYLENAGRDPAIIADVEDLLKAEAETSPILDKKLESMDVLLEGISEDVFIGRMVDSYHILHKIGQGGMGAVYMAEQKEESFHRYVAMKVIRRGMDNEQVIRRFNTERQILAALNHPNIGRLLDGGTSEDGTSYLVMEYIDGLPITEYCDSRKLPIWERLKLFKDVCSAVQYAHQNLVVHRDLKPSNILVTNEGVVKLLDFGIAKLLNPNLTPQGAMLTQAVQRLMTPEYASPEQVRGESVTTSSDVYSLGVVLYELLTGHRPYRIKSRNQEEIHRLICEKEPTRPSTIVGQVVEANLGEEFRKVTPESVSEARGTIVDRLRRQLHGDLDNIVLMAMRKEPQRRYSSVENLSKDIDRHLSGIPVVARSSTLTYRTQKFVQRHRFGVIATTAFVALFATFALLYTLQLRRESIRAKQAAEQAEQITAFMLSVFQGSNPYETQGNTVTAHQLLDQSVERIGNELADQPVVQARLFDATGLAYQSLGLYEQARELLHKSLDIRKSLLEEDDLELAESYFNLSHLHFQTLQYQEGADFARQSLKIRQARLGPTHDLTLESMANLARNAYELHQLSEADSLLQFILSHQRKTLGNSHSKTIETLYSLGLVLHGQRKYEVAEALLTETLVGFDAESLQVSTASAHSAERLARLLQFQDDHVGAERMFRRAFSINEKLYKKPHFELANDLQSIASTLVWQGKLEEALELTLVALEQEKELYGENSVRVGLLWRNAAQRYESLDRLEEAITAYETSIRIFEVSKPPRITDEGQALSNLARTLSKAKRYDEAEHYARMAIELLNDSQDLITRIQFAFASMELGRVHYHHMEYAEAESRLKTALQILKKNWSNAPNTSITEIKLFLGSIFTLQQRFQEAETLLLEALESIDGLNESIRLKPRVPEFQRRSTALLSELYRAWGFPDKAILYE